MFRVQDFQVQVQGEDVPVDHMRAHQVGSHQSKQRQQGLEQVQLQKSPPG